MIKIGVIHTTAATLQSTSELIKNTIDDAVIMNILDDTILPDMAMENNVDYVRQRWITYAYPYFALTTPWRKKPQK